MVRNLILGLFCLALAGCAAGPGSPVSTSGSSEQKKQAVQAEPLTEEQKVLMAKARNEMHAERWNQATALLSSLQSQRPEVAEVHSLLASVARQLGKNNQAESAYRTAFELNPRDAVSANNLALLLREKGQFREAVTMLQEGLEYSPDTADLHYNLAVIAELYLLDLELALAHYRRFSALTDQQGKREARLVAGWIADLERRLD